MVGTYKTYNTAFTGTSFLDYIRLGSNCPTPTANFSATDLVLCGTGAGSPTTYIDNSISAVAGTTYSWNFGVGAVPATASTAGPHSVYYSSPGWKTTTLTLNSGVSSRTKTSYVYVSPADNACNFIDHFSDNNVSSFAASQGNFTFTETGTDWNVATTGHGEWETFTLTFNNGVELKPIDFSCPTVNPTINIRAKATGNVALRVALADKTDVTMANAGVTTRTMELNTGYQIFAINLKGLFTDAYSPGGPYRVDSNDTRKLQFRVNPGFSSSPWSGPVQGNHNTPFVGTINIDYVAIGTNCAGPLPVELISFIASETSSGVLLEWTSFAETNLDHYELESIENGKVITLGIVKAIGNASSLETYSFNDLRQVQGIQYYRIKAVDKDATSQYSEIISIRTNGTADVRLFPNPSSGSFELTVSSITTEDRLIKIYSIEGNLVEEKLLVANTSSISIGEKLTSGLYFIHLNSGKELKVLKAVLNIYATKLKKDIR